MTWARYGSALCLATVLSACGHSPARDEGLPLDEHLSRLGYRQAEAVESVQRFDIDGWQYLDKQHIVVGHGPGRSYLLTFSRPCRNLSFSNTLGFSTTVGVLTRLDRVVSTDGSGFPEYCLIETIHRLEKVPRSGT
ncbi:DUF6491 family protein [Pseudomonas sp. GD03944]|uniref:DUF6491 family protein n=1 Tax=Pseudomonas sp. GD03944 TaxID=2975409 RepID=UPI00244C100A|nr:DUF6491 family protein [Pseudomonas sp. GD03944]MDH1265081.1 DUF6491 family protein [Pseudomonas sp. GD03944]